MMIKMMITMMMMMKMIIHLIFNLPHSSGLHNLLENGSLNRPKLPICHCLQLKTVIAIIMDIIVVISISIVIVIMIVVIMMMTLMLAVRLQLYRIANSPKAFPTPSLIHCD